MAEDKKKKSATVKQKYKLLNDRANKHLNKGKDYLNEDDDDGENEEKEGIFRKHIELLKKLEKKGVTGEAYDIAVLQSLHELTLALIPIAEENYRKYPIHTAASAVNGFVNQSREILNDIRALEDFQARADKLVEIVYKEFNEIAKAMINNAAIMKQELSSKDGTKHLDKVVASFLSSQGKNMESVKKQIGARIIQVMVSQDEKRK